MVVVYGMGLGELGQPLLGPAARIFVANWLQLRGFLGIQQQLLLDRATVSPVQNGKASKLDAPWARGQARA